MKCIRKIINKQLFEWDNKKEIINIAKHGVAFEDAAMVFADYNRLEVYDSIHSQYEDRWKTIGMVNDIMVVIYTERGIATRLISARKATSYERRLYYDSQEMD